MTDMTPIVDAAAALLVFGCAVVAAGIIWIHNWLRSRENEPEEDDDE